MSQRAEQSKTEPMAEQDGINEAMRDISDGVLRYKWTGSAGPGGNDFCRFIEERLGMVVDDYAICFVTQEKVAFARGYNHTVREHLIAEHGRDVIADAMSEARALHKERYDRYVADIKPDVNAK